MDELGVFCAGRAYVCLGPRLAGAEVGAPWGWFRPSSGVSLLAVLGLYFFCGSFASNEQITDRSGRHFFCGSFASNE